MEGSIGGTYDREADLSRYLFARIISPNRFLTTRDEFLSVKTFTLINPIVILLFPSLVG